MPFCSVTKVADADFPTRWGQFRIYGFEGDFENLLDSVSTEEADRLARVLLDWPRGGEHMPTNKLVLAADLVLKHGIEASEEDIQRCLAELKRPRQVPALTGPGRTFEEIAWDRKVAA